MNVPKLRFKEFDGEYRPYTIENLLNEDIKNGTQNNPGINEAKIKFINVVDLYSSIIDAESLSYIDKDIKKINHLLVEKGDLFYTRSSITYEGIGYCNLYNDEYTPITYDDHIMRVKIQKNIALPKYIQLASIVPSARKYFLAVAKRGTMTTIGQTELKKLMLNIPTIEEQKKIAAFFEKIDEKIFMQQQKIDLLQEQKKGFLQKMFPKAGETQPNLRFYGFKGEWRKYRLDRILKKDTQKNKDLEFHSEAILSVAQMKDAKNIRDSSDQYMTTYNKIRKGNLAFEGHSNKDFPNGRFILNDYRDGIVSHIYDVYSILIDHDMIFMKNYINNQQVMRKILINATSNARMMNSLNSQELLKQHIILPSIEEQKKISYFLLTLDNKIKLEENKLKSLIDQKKGFMQQMFI